MSHGVLASRPCRSLYRGRISTQIRLVLTKGFEYRYSLRCLSNLNSQRAAFASIAMLMDDNTLQLLLFCGIHVAMFFMLVCLEPFANR